MSPTTTTTTRLACGDCGYQLAGLDVPLACPHCGARLTATRGQLREAELAARRPDPRQTFVTDPRRAHAADPRRSEPL